MPVIFRFSKTEVARTIFLERIISPQLLKVAGFLTGVLVLFFGFIAAVDKEPAPALGMLFVSLAVFIPLILWQLFVAFGLRYPELAVPLGAALLEARGTTIVNLAHYLNFPAARAIARCGGMITPTRILVAILKERRIMFVFERLKLNQEELVSRLKNEGSKEKEDPQELVSLMERAAVSAARRRHERIELPHILGALAERHPVLKKFLFDYELSPQDLQSVAHWEDRAHHDRLRRQAFWSRENLLRIRGLGDEWAYGYTPTMDRYARDITAQIERKGLTMHIFGKKEEILAMERILSKAGEQNVLVIGEAGVGRETTIYGFTKRVLEGRSLAPLNGKRVVELDIGSALAGFATTSEMAERLEVILQEAVRAKNIILVIHDLHNYIGAETAVGKVDISSVLLPYIKTAALQVIGVTTYQGLHEHIERVGEFANAFERVEILPPNPYQVFAILTDLVPQFERAYGLFFTVQALRSIIDFADRYIQDIPFPEKAIDILEEVAVYASRKGRRVVAPEDVAWVVSERTKIPVGEVQAEEREKLLRLESIIHERIIDQEEAVRVIAEAMRRARAGVRVVGKRPIGTFLFLGPTGVGKTETAKAMADAYFGAEERMIRLDMSEYQEVEALDRLIGSPRTGQQGGLATAVRQNPFSLLLLDEIEKTHRNILDIFLQVFDEGHITDGFGRRTVFTHTIIIATSNAGSEFIRQGIQKEMPMSEIAKGLIERLLTGGIFKPEFLNRFDAVVVFRTLNPEHVRAVAELKLKNLVVHLFDEKGITLVVAPDALEKLVALGYNQEFGARALQRVLQEQVEGFVAQKLLAREIERGQTLMFTVRDIREI